MSLPLDGILVVDFSEGLAGPFSSQLLADQGANVIKVEPPGRTSQGKVAFNLARLSFNRNKRSISIDIEKPKGREVLDKLVRSADVIVINMRLGARRRKKLAYEHLAPMNPRLIYASITAYGELGPEAALPAVDEVVQARVGDVWTRRPPDGPPPTSGPTHYDMATALLTFGAVVLALYERQRTGRGQEIKLNILQTALALQATAMTRPGAQGGSATRAPRLPIGFLCKDGRWLFVKVAGAWHTDSAWERFCRTTGWGHLMTDPRFNTQENRLKNTEALYETLSQYFGKKTATEWEGVLKTADLITDIVKQIPEVYEDPQVIANQMIVQFEQPGLGTIQAVNFPFKLSETEDETRPPRHVPETGEHNHEVLDELGYRPAEIKALKKAGVLG